MQAQSPIKQAWSVLIQPNESTASTPVAQTQRCGIPPGDQSLAIQQGRCKQTNKQVITLKPWLLEIPAMQHKLYAAAARQQPQQAATAAAGSSHSRQQQPQRAATATAGSSHSWQQQHHRKVQVGAGVEANATAWNLLQTTWLRPGTCTHHGCWCCFANCATGRCKPAAPNSRLIIAVHLAVSIPRAELSAAHKLQADPVVFCFDPDTSLHSTDHNSGPGPGLPGQGAG